jgi:hypothetical protein
MQRQLTTAEPELADMWTNDGLCRRPATLQLEDLTRALFLALLTISALISLTRTPANDYA